MESSIDPKKFFNFSNKYENTAKLINQLVGGNSNYEEIYNCMTRLRFRIKNKNLVNIEKLKQVNLVKGTVWNGSELQIVIGQDVYKVKDEVIRLNDYSIEIKNKLVHKNENVSFIRKFLAMLSGIMVKNNSSNGRDRFNSSNYCYFNSN
ncbi:PTS transporter subunit EIIB [Spiroplasma endosymbiont of Cantharis lateralis]|uniref:PTS transporter subunit EIIB n=1 Tax=Spiroplasma endosymbiont of Cantharis lateralis TaxID=3066277 RepID=UPI00313B3729